MCYVDPIHCYLLHAVRYRKDLPSNPLKTLELQDSDDQYSPIDHLDLSLFDTVSLHSSPSSYSLQSDVTTQLGKYEEKVRRP